MMESKTTLLNLMQAGKKIAFSTKEDKELLKKIKKLANY